MKIVRLVLLFPQWNGKQLIFNCPRCPVPEVGGVHKITVTAEKVTSFEDVTIMKVVGEGDCQFNGCIHQGVVFW